MLDLVVVLAVSIIVGSSIYFLRLPRESQKQGLSELRSNRWWLSMPEFKPLFHKSWWIDRKRTVPQLFEKHRKLAMLFIIANLLDLITTYAAVNAGFTEKNPFAANLVTNHFWAAAICKILGTVAIVYAVLFLKRILMFYWFNAGFFFVAFTNALGTCGAYMGVIKPY